MAEEFKKFWVKFNYPLGENVRLPRYFTEKFNAWSADDVSLYTMDGKMSIIGLERHNNDIWLGRRWSDFKKKYNIEYGDSIYFRYGVHNIFQVVIFGFNGLEKNTENARREKRAVYFFNHLKTKEYCANMVVPDAFAKGFGKYLENPITLVGFNGVGAHVDWKFKNNWEKLTFLDGWDIFVQTHRVRRNDLLIFKFDWTKKMTVDVLPTDSPSIDHFHARTKPEPWDINANAFDLFSVTLNNSFFKTQQPLYVPARVVKSEFSHKPQIIQVKLPSAEIKEWHLIWSVAKKECKIGRGWYEFKADNNLQPGNIVIFRRTAMNGYFEVDFE